MLMISELSPVEVTVEVASHVSELMTVLASAPRTISEDDLRLVAETNHLFVGTDNGRVVGLVCLVVMRLPQGVRLWIESVIVSPSHRRTGLGRRLMEAALAKAALYGDVPISLTSNPTRGVAHHLFERLGFSRAETSVFRRSAHM
ncbi:GNAT family N-acetyltransferase [Phenylobacterium sp. 58.2.17]|uniref:GNAT family N-acetyltransferase n=1 Tax=Phenylobacterium sp. 58.2.17 TaxID=2969306 RepID=UPI0022642730|nr:GNAT family N-acetyltransferase [Phenylobacterium sp. 58.2.17]MCX7587281.1 GNAT family N-acetyltransferase [Phenylobacterium sp. 58.2.17]